VGGGGAAFAIGGGGGGGGGSYGSNSCVAHSMIIFKQQILHHIWRTIL